ncbi:YfcL family protein [Chromatiaceae bacterium AAb-1]|nr:YfcL family protein [Chromatiaceae bacterium AAb-1]
MKSEMNELQQKPEIYINGVAAYFDQLVPVATDDQLFASGYLRGHFDLAVGSLEVTGDDFEKNDILQQVEQSLQQAIDNGELTPDDQQIVGELWQHIQRIPA